MLRPEAASQEVDNRIEVFPGHPSFALQWSSRCWSLWQRRRSQRFGATGSRGEERRWNPHGHQKSGLIPAQYFAVVYFVFS